MQISNNFFLSVKLFIREEVTVEITDYIIPFQSQWETHPTTNSSGCLWFFFSPD